MKHASANIPDIILFDPQVFEDPRGFFLETFRADAMAKAGASGPFVQDNHSGSRKGVLRGLHYQIRHAQGKLVSVIRGEVFDVAVDLRSNSSFFGRWTGEVLSSENKRILWIPPGFAHGFLVLSEWADVLYKTTDYYAPEWERTLIWDDPQVKIAWPLSPGSMPILSTKDASGARLGAAEVYP